MKLIIFSVFNVFVLKNKIKIILLYFQIKNTLHQSVRYILIGIYLVLW